MVNVDIEDKLYEDVESVVNKDKIEYPSVKNFVNRAVKDRVETIKKVRK